MGRQPDAGHLCEPYPTEVRAVLEDRLSAAGMHIWAPQPGSGDIVQDGDLIV